MVVKVLYWWFMNLVSLVIVLEFFFIYGFYLKLIKRVCMKFFEGGGEDIV